MGRRTLLVALLAAVVAWLGVPAQATAQDGVSYTIPKDNPFVAKKQGQPEIWSYGLRNPFRFSFDRATGDLTIADVGQDRIEEVNFAPADARPRKNRLGRGANYGWNCFEGSERFPGAPPDCTAPGHVPPTFEYSSEGLECSVIGGYVVRDPALVIEGRYLYADLCSGELRSVELSAAGSSGDRSEILRVPLVSSFGEDAERRIYAVSLAGPVVRLIPGAGPAPILPEPIGLFLRPVYVTSEPDDADRLYVVEQGGTVKLIDGLGLPSTFLDISGAVGTDDLERGLLSIAFPPDHASSGLFYVYFTDRSGDVRIEELRRSATDPDVADPGSRRLVLRVEHRDFGNHNGGQIEFGPDGMLYAALGDGGGSGDPLGHGQNLDTLLGAMIRIDPREPAGKGGPRRPER